MKRNDFEIKVDEIKDIVDGFVIPYDGDDGNTYIDKEGTLILEFIEI